MKRREVLGATGVAFTTTLVGCVQSGGQPDSNAETSKNGDSETSQVTSTVSGPTVGDTVKTANGLKITLKDVVITNEVALKGTTSKEHHTASEGKWFVIPKVQVQNVATESREAPSRKDFVLKASGQQFPRTNIGDGEFTQPITGPNALFSNSYSSSIETGAMGTAWILYSVPKDLKPLKLAVTSVAPEEGDAPITWSIPTAKENQIILQTSFEGPDELIQSESNTYTFTSKNTGGRTGQIDYHIEYDGVGELSEDINDVVEPGETYTTEFSVKPLGLDTYRLYFAGDTFDSGDIKPPVLPVGETWTSYDRLDVTVDDITLADEMSGPDEYDEGETVTKTPVDGHQFALVHITVKNNNADGEDLLFPDDVYLDLPDQENKDPIDHDLASIESPVTGENFDPSISSYSPGEKLEGWKVFQVPKQISKGDIKVFVKRVGRMFTVTYGAKWSPSQ